MGPWEVKALVSEEEWARHKERAEAHQVCRWVGGCGVLGMCLSAIRRPVRLTPVRLTDALSYHANTNTRRSR